MFCIFYYNIPVHSTSKDGATDYVWEPNKFYSRWTEGFGYGRTNNEGYYDYKKYKKSDNVDILVMGSSHMEAAQIQQNKSTSGLLDNMLKDYYVYNIGISGHTFITCVSNLEAAITKYNPNKYIIIETNTVTFSDSDLNNALNNSVEEIPSYDGGVIGILQQNQLLRLLYHQAESFLNLENEGDIIPNSQTNFDTNFNLLNQLFIKMQEKAEKNNIKIIIMYHPSTTLNKDGSLNLSSENENIEEFSKLCKENGIYFLDMSDRFREEYEKNYILPYGFSNTSVGTGHLNKYGHEMIAEELYKLIKEEK